MTYFVGHKMQLLFKVFVIIPRKSLGQMSKASLPIEQFQYSDLDELILEKYKYFYFDL